MQTIGEFVARRVAEFVRNFALVDSIPSIMSFTIGHIKFQTGAAIVLACRSIRKQSRKFRPLGECFIHLAQI